MSALRKWLLPAVLFALLLCMVGCASWNTNVSLLQLGMDAAQVREAIGDPFVIRSSKLYADGGSSEVWEYLPPAFTWSPKTYWVYFENGLVVQWGEPGDYTGSATNVRDYTPTKGR